MPSSNPHRSMSRLICAFLKVCLCFAAGLGPSAMGARNPVAFTLEIEGNGNTPTVRLRNESRVAITGFEMTIGNFDYNFDSASGFVGLTAGGAVFVSSPDTTNGGSRMDTVSL